MFNPNNLELKEIAAKFSTKMFPNFWQQYNTIQYNTLYLTKVNILTFYSFLAYGTLNITK